MGTFKEFLKSKGISEKQLLAASHRVEKGGLSAHQLHTSRTAKRRTQKEVSYADAKLTKPSSNRPLSARQLQGALSDSAQPVRVRSKLLRAVNAVLTGKKQTAVDMQAILAGAPIRKVVKKEAEAKK